MSLFKRFSAALALLTLAFLAACSTPKDLRRLPTPLAAIKPELQVKQVWSANVGATKRYLFQPIAVGEAIYAAATNGTVVKIDATNGREVWRKKLPTVLTAGVGSDGELTAVGGKNGHVYTLDDQGKLLWSADAKGEILTSPLVGYGVVLVRTTDGNITAFNGLTGEQKWVFHNRSIPLNLRATSGMIFAGETAFIAGFPGGSLAAINLATGEAYWQIPVSYPTGVTEVERINDVVGTPTLVGREVCSVTFQGRIACFDAQTGQAIWEHPFSSYGGLAQAETALAAANEWSAVSLYDAATGRSYWQNTKLQGRNLSSPAIIGAAVVVGDYKGFMHFLSAETGDFVARIKTDGSAITAQPVLAGQTLVVQTHNGHLYAFRPQ